MKEKIHALSEEMVANLKESHLEKDQLKHLA